MDNGAEFGRDGEKKTFIESYKEQSIPNLQALLEEK